MKRRFSVIAKNAKYNFIFVDGFLYEHLDKWSTRVLYSKVSEDNAHSKAKLHIENYLKSIGFPQVCIIN